MGRQKSEGRTYRMTDEKDKRIKELEEENRKLKEENKELKQILNLFHNPHTLPSKQRLKRKKKKKGAIRKAIRANPAKRQNLPRQKSTSWAKDALGAAVK